MKPGLCLTAISAPLLAVTLLAPGSQAFAQAGDWHCDRSPLAVTNASLWNEGRPLRNREVLVAGGRIVAIGRSGRVRRPEGSRVIDARDGWLLPGLIDSHAHTGRAGAVPAEILPQPNPGSWWTTGRQTLASGVTTVRIHLGDREWVPALAGPAADDCSPSPRIVLGGRGLQGGDAALDTPLITGVAGAADARSKVQASARVGAAWIALYEAHRFAPDELAAIVDEARRAGILLMASAGSAEEGFAGLEAGARSLEYIDQSPAQLYSERLIAEIRRRGTFVVPPIGFHTRYVAYRRNPALIDDPLYRRFELPAVGAALTRGTRQRFEQPPASEQGLVDNFPTVQAKFRQLLAARLNLVVGSDSGSQGHFHADAIWWELRAWRDNGAPVNEILTAATSRPAAMLGLADRASISVGARGDFLIYDRDLARGDLDLAGVRVVAKGGVVYVRDGRWVGPGVPGEQR